MLGPSRLSAATMLSPTSFEYCGYAGLGLERVEVGRKGHSQLGRARGGVVLVTET